MVVAIFLAAGGACFLAMSVNPVTALGDQRVGLVILFLAGFFVYGAQGPLWAMCPDLVGKSHAGTAVGLMDAVAYAGAAAQGPLLGYIVDASVDYGYRVAFLLLTVVACGGATLALLSATAASTRANNMTASASESEKPS
jgi:OPA family glycerol-3-phosphate transporter-like MFS transporter